MSGATSSGVESFGRVDILEVGRTYRVLSEELVCKALDEDPGPSGVNLAPVEAIELSPQDKERLADILANKIGGALANLRPDDSENEILDLIEDTFAVVRLKKRLENETNRASNTLRETFYERMSSRDPGVGITEVTHSEETNEYDPDAHPIVQVATDFLLDEDCGGALIPSPVQSRAKKDWKLLKKKAKEWSSEYNMSETETCGEIIAATIAVEVHTGGDPDHTRPYERYISKERGATWSQLDEVPTHPVDRRLMKWYEDMNHMSS